MREEKNDLMWHRGSGSGYVAATETTPARLPLSVGKDSAGARGTG